MRTLGIIGGLGPLATAYLSELLVRRCDVLGDQQHLDTIVYCHPSIPDRTAHILDENKPSPVPEIIKAGLMLKGCGVEAIAIPCVTSHYFYHDIQEGIGLPVINMLECVLNELIHDSIKNVGIMATTGTVSTGIFQRTFEKSAINSIVPDERHQKTVMHIIYDCIKAGKPALKADFDEVSEYLESMGAERIILGCTELSLVKRECKLEDKYLDALEALADNCLTYFNMPIKDKKRIDKCVDL